MSANAADFYTHAIAKHEADDWRACWASAPVTLSDVESGELMELWAFYRPLSAVEQRAWGLPFKSGLVGVLTAAECAGGVAWTLERYLVRLPVGIASPRTSGGVLWAASFVSDGNKIELTPATVERLRLAPPISSEASA
jgi:hypothetical protein